MSYGLNSNYFSPFEDVMKPLSINIHVDSCVWNLSHVSVVSPDSKLQFHETTNGPVSFARWQRSTRTEMMQRSWRLSAWPPDVLAEDEMLKGPAMRLLLPALILMEGKRCSLVLKELIWTSLVFLYLYSDFSAFSVSWIVTSLPWNNNTSDRAIKPQTLTWSHGHKHNPVVLSSTRCLKLSF